VGLTVAVLGREVVGLWVEPRTLRIHLEWLLSFLSIGVLYSRHLSNPRDLSRGGGQFARSHPLFTTLHRD
jgi:hypothetical protein